MLKKYSTYRFKQLLILYFEYTIFREVSAVNGILDSIKSEFRSQGVWSKSFGKFWVMRAANLSESIDGIFLSISL
jgi:hypothetical protein